MPLLVQGPEYLAHLGVLGFLAISKMKQKNNNVNYIWNSWLQMIMLSLI